MTNVEPELQTIEHTIQNIRERLRLNERSPIQLAATFEAHELELLSDLVFYAAKEAGDKNNRFHAEELTDVWKKMLSLQDEAYKYIEESQHDQDVLMMIKVVVPGD